MKRNRILTDVLFADVIAFPLLLAVSLALGYRVLIRGGGVGWAVATSVIFVVCAALLLQSPSRELGRLHTGLLLAALPLSMVNALCYVLKAKTGVFALLLALWFVPLAILAAVFVRARGWKIAAFTVSGLLSLPLALFLFISFYPPAVEVAASAVSPDRAYCAEVITADQGALGGDTVLEVYRMPESFDIGSFSFRKDTKRIVQDDWNAGTDVQWIGNETIAFNGERYSIKPFYG